MTKPHHQRRASRSIEILAVRIDRREPTRQVMGGKWRLLIGMLAMTLTVIGIGVILGS